MARTGRPRQFNRDEALQGALTLFWRQGYEPTSLSQIKEVMGGISPTSFYAAFGSKDQLFNEVVELYRASYGRVTEVLGDETLPPRDAIETCLRRSAAMQTDRAHPPGCLFVLAGSNCSMASEPVIEVLRKERRKNHEAIKAQVRRGVSNGDLPATTDIEALSAAFNGFLLGISTAARDGATKEELLGSVDQVMRMWPKA